MQKDTHKDTQAGLTASEQLDAHLLQENERIKNILESASTRHFMKRVVHEVTGHPKDQVHWGTSLEGATCACGSHWTNADYRV